MKLLFAKIVLYAFLIFIFLEIIVRVFHLQQEYPPYMINDLGIEVSQPNHKGYYVTGNRRMNFVEYKINESGFNSYREFKPTQDDVEIALVGDSFIEGFHQNYYNSLGKKIENLSGEKVKVFEYGYSGYDLADQLHLIDAYKDKFELIDHVIIYLKFYTDLERDVYKPNQYRVDLQNSLSFKLRDNIKLLAYTYGIGALAPLRNTLDKILGRSVEELEYIDDHASEEDTFRYLENFKKLIKTYKINKAKTYFLLDTRKTSKLFLDYCDESGIKYIDYNEALKNAKKPTTLIYDMHWNNYGRSLIAKAIVEHLNIKKPEH